MLTGLQNDHSYAKRHRIPMQNDYDNAGFESVANNDAIITSIEHGDLGHIDEHSDDNSSDIQEEQDCVECTEIYYPQTSAGETVIFDEIVNIMPHESSVNSKSLFTPDTENETSTTTTITDWIVNQSIVAINQLLLLFRICRHPGCGKDTNLPLNIRKQGFAMFIKAMSPQCHVSTWNSQPLIGNIPYINLQLPAAIFISGNSYSAFLEICNLTKILSLQERQYYNLQSTYFIPQVGKVWQQHNESDLAAIGNTSLILAGDARHDSPGHCATFGTYTLLDNDSNLIVSTETVKSTEVDNSYWLDIEGLRRCLDHMSAQGNNISILTTDRHGGIAKLLRAIR